MDDKKQQQAPQQSSGKKPYTQDKTPEQVKRDCQAFQARVQQHVRAKYMQDAKPIYVDKG